MKKNEKDIISKTKRMTFIKNSWDILSLSQSLIKQRLERAQKNENAIDMIIEEISSLPPEELTDDVRRSLAKNIAAIRLEDIGKLSSVISSAYDKAALAEGKATMNLKGELESSVKKFEDL